MAALTLAELKKRAGRIETLVRLFSEGEVSSSYMKKSSEFGGGGVVKKAGGGGGSESLGIRAETMILGGKLEKVNFGGHMVECRTFTKTETLVNSIIDGLKKNNKVPKYIVEDFEKYKKSRKFDMFEWSESIPDNEMNQLGKYAGEVVTGVVGIDSKYRKALRPNILGSKPVAKFCVPTDPAFTGVDVFFLMKDGDIVPVSNKYGKGAAASFFANVLPKAMKVKLKNSPLKDFVDVANKFATPEKMEGRGAPSKQILFEYGTRNLLKIPTSKIKDPYKEIYEVIKSGKQTPATRLVISAVDKYLGVDAVVIKNLPNSITAFFCREVAKQMNNSKQANNDLRDILAGKNYWQANLDIKDWFNSGNVKVDVIGSKAPTTDITAKQGLIELLS
jgi:hypothetical protein